MGWEQVSAKRRIIEAVLGFVLLATLGHRRVYDRRIASVTDRDFPPRSGRKRRHALILRTLPRPVICCAGALEFFAYNESNIDVE
jgi:hypothetical protein